jgi:hypothetical protein
MQHTTSYVSCGSFDRRLFSPAKISNIFAFHAEAHKRLSPALFVADPAEARFSVLSPRADVVVDNHFMLGAMRRVRAGVFACQKQQGGPAHRNLTQRRATSRHPHMCLTCPITGGRPTALTLVTGQELDPFKQDVVCAGRLQRSRHACGPCGAAYRRWFVPRMESPCVGCASREAIAWRAASRVPPEIARAVRHTQGR